MIYLVLVDCALTHDGGHIHSKPETYWVEAKDKRAAAATAARWVRQKHGDTLVKDRVVRVVSREDWGVKYFTTLNEKDFSDERDQA